MRKESFRFQRNPAVSSDSERRQKRGSEETTMVKEKKTEIGIKTKGGGENCESRPFAPSQPEKIQKRGFDVGKHTPREKGWLSLIVENPTKKVKETVKKESIMRW